MIKRGLLGSLIGLLIMAGLSLYGMSVIPEGEQIPVHWGISGEPDKFWDRDAALWLPLLLAAGLSVLLAVIPLIDPRKRHLAQSSAFYVTSWWGTMGILVLAHGMIVLTGAGFDIAVPRVIVIGVALLWAALGNVMGKVRSNFFAGIRTPWTLSSDMVWDRTHRLAGRLMVLSGLSLVVFGILGPEEILVWGLLIAVLGVSLFAVLMSYVFWLGRDRDEE